MEDIPALLRQLEEILKEDKSEIHHCMGGDFLFSYELYIKEEIRLFEMIKQSVFSFI